MKLLAKLLPLTFLTFLACNYSDYSEELSGNYFYSNEGEEDKAIFSHNPNGNHIFSTVVDFSFNKDFIIALQKPHWENHKTSIAFFLRNNSIKYPTNSIEEIKISEKAAENILNEKSFYKNIFLHQENFYIISHKENILYGPYKKDEYLKKKIYFKIPDSLKLKSELISN